MYLVRKHRKLTTSTFFPGCGVCCVNSSYSFKICIFRAEEHLPNTLRQALIYKVMLKTWILFISFFFLVLLALRLCYLSAIERSWFLYPYMILPQALGFSMPYFAHVSLILAPDRSKLSKRHGATSVGQVIINHYYWSSHTHNQNMYIEKLGMRSSCAFFVLIISLFLLAFLLIRRLFLTLLPSISSRRWGIYPRQWWTIWHF